MCTASLIKGYTHFGYLTNCTPHNTTEDTDKLVEWYWKLVPLIMYNLSRTLATVLLLEFTIGQSPDK